MQPVKSGFNSPASFNLPPCLLINDSAPGVPGIQIFCLFVSIYKRIQCRGCALRVSSRLCHVSFEAASLWISLPQQHLQTLSSLQQLHRISSQGPVGIPTCSPSRCSWFSATWLYFWGHRLLLGLCHATSDRLWKPNVPHHLPGAPSSIAGPGVLCSGSFLQAAGPMLLARPSCLPPSCFLGFFELTLIPGSASLMSRCPNPGRQGFGWQHLFCDVSALPCIL